MDPDEAGYTIAGKDSIQYEAPDVRSRIDRVPEEAIEVADEITAEADSVEALVAGLDKLLEEYDEEEQTLDDVVADASSIDQVRRDVETPQERAARQAKELANERLEPVRIALRDANPQEVGEWGLSVGKASLPMAIAASASTPLLAAAALAVGGAAGVHSSGVEGSPLANIEPQELSQHVVAMADSGKDLDEIDSEVAGSLLGAFTYLGGQMAPEEFVKWIEAADPEAILAGANAGVAYANRDDVDGAGIEGAIAGGSLGLLGSYAGVEMGGSDASEGDPAEAIASLLEEVDEQGMESEE